MAARAEVSPSTVHYRPSSHLVARRQRHDQRVEPAGPSQRRALHTERHHRHHGNQVSSARRPARPGTHLDHQPRESQRSPGSNRANDAVSYSAHHHPRRGIVMFLVTSARMCVCMCVWMYLHCVSKNIPNVFSYNSRKQWRIFIIFGRNVTEKASNHILLYFSTSPNCCFYTTLWNWKHENCIFSRKYCMLICQ